MYRPLALYIGLRYTRAKRRNHFISFISAASILGIALGVAALIVVISVMNGFEQELRTRILGMVAHATITGIGEDLSDWQGAQRIASENPNVLGSAPYVEREALFQGRRVSGAIVRGVMPVLETSVSEIGEKMVEGSLDDLRPGEFGIVLGLELSYALSAHVGDSVTLYAPQARSTPAGMIPTVKRFRVVGIFEIGMYEYDRGTSVIHMQDAQKLFRMRDQVTGLRLHLTDLFDAWTVSETLTSQLKGNLQVRDWTQQHANFFRAIRTEKMVMFIILSMLVGIAAFNLVSTLVMVVTDKQADIAILRTMGASPSQIMRVFMVQGITIGVLGTLLGIALGVLIASNVETLVPLLEQTFGFKALPGDVYYINQLPSELRPYDVARIGLVALLFSAIATIYPAWRASRTEPARALRYE